MNDIINYFRQYTDYYVDSLHLVSENGITQWDNVLNALVQTLVVILVSMFILYIASLTKTLVIKVFNYLKLHLKLITIMYNRKW